MLGKQPFDVGKANRAQKIWNDKGSCYDCHDPEGVGNEAIGAANLTAPRLYLYGSDRQSITQSITFGRHGVSPAFEGKLTAGEIKAVSVYVFSFAKHG
jgi:cytochrome c oxidase cbb3-type subunit 3